MWLVETLRDAQPIVLQIERKFSIDVAYCTATAKFQNGQQALISHFSLAQMYNTSVKCIKVYCTPNNRHGHWIFLIDDECNRYNNIII